MKESMVLNLLEKEEETIFKINTSEQYYFNVDENSFKEVKLYES